LSRSAAAEASVLSLFLGLGLSFRAGGRGANVHPRRQAALTRGRLGWVSPYQPSRARPPVERCISEYLSHLSRCSIDVATVALGRSKVDARIPANLLAFDRRKAVFRDRFGERIGKSQARIAQGGTARRSKWISASGASSRSVSSIPRISSVRIAISRRSRPRFRTPASPSSPQIADDDVETCPRAPAANVSSARAQFAACTRVRE
jgi:hypothetical protein